MTNSNNNGDTLFLEFQEAIKQPGLPKFQVRTEETILIDSHPEEKAALIIHLKEAKVLQKLFVNPDFLSLGESYLEGDFDIEGDIEAIYSLAEVLMDLFKSRDNLNANLDIAYQPETQASRHQVERDAESIQFHYDLSNRVYELITGKTLSYSSACFETPNDTLDEAQFRKMERVCLKLNLKDGERLLDIGSGWGSMMRHAATTRKIAVHGVTVAKEQVTFVEKMIENIDVPAENWKVDLCDYRKIETEEPYDKICSLGMVEHVGVANLETYFNKAFSLLKSGGYFLCQGCLTNPNRTETNVTAFAQHYLFPDAEFPYLTQYIKAAEQAGFELRDVDMLREHYALTHRHWRLRLQANKDEIVGEIGETRYRALRLLYSYSTHYFLRWRAGVTQMLFYKPLEVTPFQERMLRRT